MATLRSRLLAGAILWTIGLFIVAFVIVTIIMLENPRAPRIVHSTAHAYAVTLVFVATACMIAGFVQVRKGLSPINQLRQRLGAVQHGQVRRMEGAYPSEVQPLVDELNALLQHHERLVQRALAKAGDLAHGLKTPLAVLAQEAEQIHRDGHTDAAATLAAQIQRMQRQIDYHLAHARAAASGQTPGVRCSVRESAEGLVRTLDRLYATRRIRFCVNVPPEHFVRGQREDLDEMLGNLLENACKWTKTQVSIASSVHNGRIRITVDDDGPGLALAMREAVLQRGIRADEQSPGSGLGLAIVRDLADLYGGTIVLDAAPDGGLRAHLDLPAAEHADRSA
jgi:signal transduction histidine kinase